MADRLAAWKVDGNTELTTLDFGTVVAGSSDDLFFRVKNLSSLYTALDVLVTLTGTNQNDCYLSLDGKSFGAIASLGNLPPSADSPVITLRRVTPSTSSTGSKSCTVRLQASAWQ